MNKLFGNVLIVIALLFLPHLSLAQNYEPFLGRFSMAVGIGSSQFDLNEQGIISDYNSVTNSSTFSDSVTSFNLFLGYQLDEHLAIESELVTAGDVTARDGGISTKLFDVSTFTVNLALSKSISERTSLYGRIGAHFWDISESSGALDTINNAVDLTYGLGMDINIYGDRSRQFRLQWNHYEYDEVYINSNDILSANILFQIGG